MRLKNMPIRITALACFLLLFTLAGAVCQERISVAVMDLKVTGISKDEVDLLVDFLNNALFETGSFDVVQRSRRDQLIKEIEFSYSDVADPARTKTLGRLLASKLLVFGSIGRIGTRVLFNLSTVEVETGRTVSTHSKSYNDLEQIIGDCPKIAQTISQSARKYLAEKGEVASADEDFFGKATLLYSEDFEEATWLQTEKLYYENGRYYIYSTDQDWYTWQQHAFDDFVYEVEAQWQGGKPDYGFGIIFRVQDADNYYLFDITKTGYYKVDKRIAGSYHALTEWERSSAIDPQGINYLKVRAVGKRLSFYINNNSVKELVDDTFSKGEFGLFSAQDVRAAFDNIRIYQGKLLIYENFNGAVTGWTQDDTAFIRNREYVLIPDKDGYFSWRGETLKDFSYKADVKWLKGSTDQGYGLVFNMLNIDNNYSFTITKNGYYMLGRYREGLWEDLIPWRKSRLINLQGKNTLKVQTRGSRIELFVNGNLVEEYEDEQPIEGQIGFVSFADVHSCFDEVEVFLLE
jgi:hypothetical protein